MSTIPLTGGLGFIASRSILPAPGRGLQTRRKALFPSTLHGASRHRMPPGGESSKAGAARIIGVVATVNGSIEIDSMAEPGCVHPAASTIDIDMTTRV
jgi:hypothetical protein